MTVSTPTREGMLGCWGVGRERKSAARSMIVSCYAGLIAHRMAVSDAEEDRAASDEKVAFNLSSDHGVFPRRMAYIGDEAHGDYLEGLRREARRTVRKLRPIIAGFAEELLRRRCLSAEEPEAVYGIPRTERQPGSPAGPLGRESRIVSSV